MKKVLIITTSLRPGSNSELLAQEFARGAESAGHQVELLSLVGKQIAFCRGCLACQKLGRCVMTDDAQTIADKVKEAEVVVFATPVYYYGMSGQMKTLLDRMNCLYPADYAFRDIYLIGSAADDADTALDRTVCGLEGWIECFEKCRLAGVVKGAGNESAGDVRGKAVQLETARAMGAAV